MWSYYFVFFSHEAFLCSGTIEMLSCAAITNTGIFQDKI